MAYLSLPLDEYQKLARKTASPETIDDPVKQLVNAALGLVGEVGEICDAIKKHVFHSHKLDTDNLLEKIGDTNWYVAQLCWSRGWLMGDLIRGPYIPSTHHKGVRGMQRVALVLGGNVGRIADLVDQHVFMGLVLQPVSLKNEAMRTIYDLEILAHLLGSNGDRCRESNIAKLRLRYPAGFTAQKSISREDTK